MKNLFFKVLTFSLCVTMLTNNPSFDTLSSDMGTAEKTHYSSTEGRGVWHRPNSSGRETDLAGICSVLDGMAAAGINMVFVETFYHGMAVFKTNLVPYYTGFDAYDYGEYPDYLTAFAAEAHKRGIEVHAWVESFYLGVNPDTALVKYFPDWLLINESGKINHTTEGANLGGYIFFDPANTEARGYLVKLYDELLGKVPHISGLNLDYIRYPVSDFSNNTDTGYTEVSMSGFAAKYGFSLSENDRLQNFKAQIKAKNLVDKWTDYRAEQVTAFLGEVYGMVCEKHRDSVISIAVHPDISNAYNTKKQDFLTWVERGYIDVVTPMVYYYNAGQISYALDTMLKSFEGVYCYGGLYTTYHNQDTSELEAHIGACESAGTDGFVLFESVKTFFNPACDYAGFLHERYGENPARSALPHWDSGRLIAAAKSEILDTLAKNGETDESRGSIAAELDRIAEIGEGSAEKLDLAISEITRLKDQGLTELGKDTLEAVESTLSRLSDHLTVRRTRLSFKGYPSDSEDVPDTEEDDAPSVDSGENGSDANPDTDGAPPENDGDDGHRTLWDIIKDFFLRIINWFKGLFTKDGSR